MRSNRRTTIAGLGVLVLLGTSPVFGADLGADAPIAAVEPSQGPGRWSLEFTTYGWLPWLDGDLTVKGRTVSVEASPGDIIDALDWSGLPMWMSYTELSDGQLTLFNDIVYTKLTGSGGFDRSRSGRFATLSLAGDVEADYEQATVELGAAYKVWESGPSKSPGHSAIDLLAGGRYWYQEVNLSAEVNATLAISGPLGLVNLVRSGDRVFSRSGSVDWIDPFIGARLRQQIAPGQELILRGDIGGFDVGSESTWQVLATYNFQLCLTEQYTLDGYLGYRALSVDYSQGSGDSKYEFDVLMQGPVLGATLHF